MKSERRRQTDREHQQRRSLRLAQLNLCIGCGVAPRSDGTVRCSLCREMEANRHTMRKIQEVLGCRPTA